MQLLNYIKIVQNILTVNLLRFSSVITTNSSEMSMPKNWPSDWNNSTIPYVFNFYSPSPKRLISLVQKGHYYIEENSCLTFKEYDPRQLAVSNSTYLYYTYSGVLENCCLPFFKKPYGRRLVLISPLCTLPGDVAHATLHAMGLRHKKHHPFPRTEVMSILFMKNCEYSRQDKVNGYESEVGNMYGKK